jgi:formylglycine-generating enzyme required for sulfatase activity
MHHHVTRLVFLTIVLLAACSGESAMKPVTSNADWEPRSRTYNDVKMVQVPPGCFNMGSDYGRRDELPVHEVCFSEPFWIDRYEVTNAQYGSEGPFPGENRPRTNLTWLDVRDYCARRGARLPTEAEWEYAARGPDNLIYPWGNTLVDDYVVYERTSPGEVADVGSRPEGMSWVGAYDMSGNVWEWVSSMYRPYPYDANDGREDLTNTTSRRVYRSGVRSYIDYGISTSIRFWMFPNERDWFLGFRCAKSN